MFQEHDDGLINLFEKNAMYFDSALSCRAYFNALLWFANSNGRLSFFCANQEFEIVLTLKNCGLIKWENRGSNAASESVIVICKSRVHDAEIINMSIIIAW